MSWMALSTERFCSSWETLAKGHGFELREKKSMTTENGSTNGIDTLWCTKLDPLNASI
jgi:hypothetical protein